MLHSAGLAVQALTNSKSSSSIEADTLDSRKAAFKAATSQYFALLSSIDVRLRRQVYALEEAGILTPDSASRTVESTGATATGTNSAANPLEISWLNSRKDTVGKDKEAEIWAATREFITRLQTAPFLGESSEKNNGLNTGEHIEKMELD